jgi:hypothetical protein
MENNTKRERISTFNELFMSFYPINDIRVTRSFEEELHNRVTLLDPLNADDIMKSLPSMNDQNDLKGLVSALSELVKRASAIGEVDADTANAIMRDVGMFLGSIKRQAKEPVELVQGLEALLLKLSAINGLPPRDTIIHYALWNPHGARKRTFTHYADESNLIDCVRYTIPSVESAIYNLIRLFEIPLYDSAFAATCEEVEEDLSILVEMTIVAMRTVSPALFGSQLRLYYDGITVAGNSYMGPGAVEMPVFVVDHLLWSSQTDSKTHQTFKETYLPYIKPELRAIYKEYDRSPSLLDRVYTQIGNTNPVVNHSISSLLKIFNRLISFRSPHKKMANEAYKEDAHNPRITGSGGNTPEILEDILSLTIQARNRLFEKR